MENFQYKATPFAHQKRIFEATWDKPYYGLLLEQRTGKSQIVIVTAAQLHATGKINSLLIIAPNGVHRNWASDEIPKHLPDWVERYVAVWSPDKTKKKEAELEKLFDRGTQLRIFTINIEAVGTKRGFEFIKRFLNATDALVAVDESTRIKNPSTVTVKNLMKLRDLAKYRRILNGTPITQSPLDMYSQLLFLDDYAVPVQSFVAFKARYADFLPSYHPMVQKIMQRTGTRWAPQIIATKEDGTPSYKNLDELKAYVDKCCVRVTRKECVDVPDKLYKRWEVEYPPHHKNIVHTWVENMRKGHTPEPIEKMTAVMFYQRLLCGLIPYQLTGTVDESIWEKPEDNPRLQAIIEIIEEYPDAHIIFWARFRKDLHEISAIIEKVTNKTVARYWGDISDNEREIAKQGFQDGTFQYFVGQQGAGGVGLPLHKADVMVYHSNTFSLYERLQSEDRAENLQKTNGTVIIDLEVPNTIDSKIINALRNKKDVANLITGDSSDEWLK